ncbi:MAG: response regulator transcription factor [Verrucomicrobiota bacterium]
MKILVAEDDPVTRESIEACLETEGFETMLAADGKEAIEIWKADPPDLVCLDIMMPEVDGYEVCRRIRESDGQLPILFLSAKNEEIDVVVGLEIGADDFIRKPFGKHELLARIRSALRRSKNSTSSTTPNVFCVKKSLKVYPAELRAIHEETGEAIDLSPREVAILALLSQHVGEVVSRDRILDHCWGMDYFPESRTLDQHIAKLRKRIERDPAHPEIIETVRGVGYRIR